MLEVRISLNRAEGERGGQFRHGGQRGWRLRGGRSAATLGAKRGMNTVYFDLETRRIASDVGGWDFKDQMGISAAVTWSTATGEYHIWREETVDGLIEQLRSADLVVGYNHVSFDYAVLGGYTILDLAAATVNLDMMVDLEVRVGRRMKLDTIAHACFGEGKTADGLDAVRWWRAYEKDRDFQHLRKIAEYCAYDVKVTRLVHEFGLQEGLVKYIDKASNQAVEVAVDWKERFLRGAAGCG